MIQTEQMVLSGAGIGKNISRVRKVNEQLTYPYQGLSYNCITSIMDLVQLFPLSKCQ